MVIFLMQTYQDTSLPIHLQTKKRAMWHKQNLTNINSQ